MAQVSLGLAGSFSHGRVITELLQADDPAVGEPFVYVLPGDYWERPVSLAFNVLAGVDDAVTDVQVFYLDETGANVVLIETGPAIDANTSAAYSLFSAWSGASSWSNSVVNAALPPMYLQPTWTLGIQVDGTFSEGQITSVRYYRERFITGPGGYEIGRTLDEDQLADSYRIVADTLA